MDELSTAIKDISAGIESATAKIEDVSTNISATESELGTAIAFRKKEDEEFVNQEKELLETTREFDATTSTQNNLSFVQFRSGKVGPAKREALNALVAGLGRLVEASFWRIIISYILIPLYSCTLILLYSETLIPL